MSNLHLVLKKSKFIVLGLALLLFTATSYAQEAEKGRLGKISDIFERAKTDAEVTKRLSDFLDKIAAEMKVPRSQVFNFFKEESKNMSEASSVAWNSLLNGTKVKSRGNVTQDDFTNAELTSELVGSFITAKNTKIIKNLPFNEVDLAQVSKTWDLKQKTNFSRVLKRTAEIAQNGSIPTLNDAFTQALKELGYYDEYQKGCVK